MDGEDHSIEDSNSEEMLEQLRRWQQEQKSVLQQKQQLQRQLLLEKQKKLLTLINSADVSNRSVDNAEDEDKCSSDLMKSPTSVDDVPLKKPRSVKTFQQLLETSLNSKNGVSKVTDVSPNKKAFTFLKRGQGISRFGVISKPNKLLPQKAPALKKHQSINKENKEPPAQLKKKPDTGKKTVGQFPGKPTVLPQFTAQTHSLPTSTGVEVVQNDQPNISEVVPYHSAALNNFGNIEVNSSRNEEDLAVFELLERFATINASFSSSSSLIGQLIDKGVTHLPSPSRVISFLSKKRVEFHPEDAASPDLQKTKTRRKQVHFAESLELSSEDLNKPWLSGIAMTNEESSPYVSNTVRPIRNTEQVNLDETPTSPIGFPDYQKLFGLPARSLWAAEERTGSPTNVESPIKNLTDPSLDLKGYFIIHF